MDNQLLFQNFQHKPNHFKLGSQHDVAQLQKVVEKDKEEFEAIVKEEHNSYLDSKMAADEKVFVKSFIQDQLSLDFMASDKVKEEIRDIGDKIVSITTKTKAEKVAALMTNPMRKVMGPGTREAGCFDTAILQCLVSSKVLGKFFLTKKYRTKERKVQHVCRLFTDLWEQMLQDQLEEIGEKQEVNIEDFSKLVVLPEDE